MSLSRRCPCLDESTLRAAFLYAIRLTRLAIASCGGIHSVKRRAERRGIARFLYAGDAANSKTAGKWARVQKTGRKEKGTENRSPMHAPSGALLFVRQYKISGQRILMERAAQPYV